MIKGAFNYIDMRNLLNALDGMSEARIVIYLYKYVCGCTTSEIAKRRKTTRQNINWIISDLKNDYPSLKTEYSEEELEDFSELLSRLFHKA